MATAFSVSHLKGLLSQFHVIASKVGPAVPIGRLEGLLWPQLAQKWKDEITTDKANEPMLNISEWFERAALDIIGEGGNKYKNRRLFY